MTIHPHFLKLFTTQHFSVRFLVTAALLSMGLGALHAVESGNGEAMVATGLAGSRGTASHGFLLGILLTAAHTATVFALGAVTLFASRFLLPERFYPWLSLLSGLAIAALGAFRLLHRWTGEEIDHAHPAMDRDGQCFSSKQVHARTIRATTGQTRSLTRLFILGARGVLLPCPAAFVALLSAFALYREGFGFFLISAFSFGVAGVLIGSVVPIVSARRLFTRLAMDGPFTRRWLPAAPAFFMTLLGAAVAGRGFAASGISLHSVSQQKLGPALFVAGLGLVLGIRHSTDADHVVAISTIVTRQRSIRGAALIGSLWGLGHTATIFVVGCLIILGGVAIPPRIGLSMEFSVGLMLILLGVLNLTGLMQKIVARLTPARLAGRHQSDDSGAASENAIKNKNLIASAVLGASAPRLNGRMSGTISRFGIYQLLRPLAVGLVHGLAGSAAVALLVLSTIHNPLWAVGYLVIFGGGTMLGMMGMTAAMSLPLVYAGGRLPQLGRYLGVASGLVSVCFGSFLVYQLGYLNGLLPAIRIGRRSSISTALRYTQQTNSEQHKRDAPGCLDRACKRAGDLGRTALPTAVTHGHFQNAQLRTRRFHLHLKIPAIGHLGHVQLLERVASDGAERSHICVADSIENAHGPARDSSRIDLRD